MEEFQQVKLKLITWSLTEKNSLSKTNHLIRLLVHSLYAACSIQNIDKALKEIYHVLKPDGKFFFQEHGLANDLKIRKWQNRMNPFQKIWADGCNLNRDIKLLIENAGFNITEFKNYFLEKGPKTHTFMYEGIACK